VSAERPIRFDIDGDGGVVSSEVATSLSLVVTELLQNAVEHAFPDSVEVTERRVGIELRHDDSPHRRGGGRQRGRVRPRRVTGAGSLGQSIVTALVRDELRGTIEYRVGGAIDGDPRRGDGAVPQALGVGPARPPPPQMRGHRCGRYRPRTRHNPRRSARVVGSSDQPRYRSVRRSAGSGHGGRSVIRRSCAGWRARHGGACGAPPRRCRPRRPSPGS
jgi:hypothetical protein